MKISPIILKLRLADTRFKNLIGGAADMEAAISETLGEAAYVVPLSEVAKPNNMGTGLIQDITEIFAVVVVLNNDTTNKDKQGFYAYDSLYDVRSEIFGAILGWLIPEEDNANTERVIDYRGGMKLEMHAGYLWWAFEFSVVTRICDEDGADNSYDAQADFNKIYAEYILAPDADNLPLSGMPPLLPVDDATITDMIQQVDEDTDYNGEAR